MGFQAQLLALATSRLGEAMSLKTLLKLARANHLVKFFQWRVWRNGLPIAHDALGVNDLACQHGRCVHRERQNVHSFLAAINFHVCACGLVVHASGGFLGQPVIQNTPKTSDVARFFNPVQIQVVSAGVNGVNLGPIGLGRTAC